MKRDNSALLIQLKAIRSDIDAALATIAAKHGIEITTGKATYDPSALNFTFKVEGQFPGGMTKEGALYEQIRQIEGGLPELNWEFDNGGRTFAVVGCNTTGTKIHGKCKEDGKTYLFATDGIRRIAEKQGAPNRSEGMKLYRVPA